LVAGQWHEILTKENTDKQVQCTRSAVLAMAIQHGHITVDEALAASRLEENVQQKNWGLVEGSHDVTEADLGMRLFGAALYLDLLENKE